MNIGDNVIYNHERYIIQWIYESGYCEITHTEKPITELVHLSEIKNVEMEQIELSN